MDLQFDPDFALTQLPEDWLSSQVDALHRAHNMLEEGNGPGGAFTGWVHLPTEFSPALLAKIKNAAQRIAAQSQALVVVGIGGSYLGAKALIELLRSPNYNLLAGDKQPQVFFAGQTLSADGVNELLLLLENKSFSINVISKSGSTMETSAAFLLLQNLLEQRYGIEGARQRIFVTTDLENGILRDVAFSKGYECFPLPKNIGGRYSVLTSVGLLPLAVAGIDIDAILDGAQAARTVLQHPGEENPAWQYAAARNALYNGGKKVELLASYDPYFRSFGEWWKQLFGESEGKDGKGLFPAVAEFSADLHSMGQYIQDGPRLLLETIVCFDQFQSTCPIPSHPDAGSDLSFLCGQDLQFVADQAFLGTLFAHVDGGVPNLLIHLPVRGAKQAGELVYFFQYSCALSAYLLGVNPFDQPGVEAYKANMMALLGKPGLEEQRRELESRFF